MEECEDKKDYGCEGCENCEDCNSCRDVVDTPGWAKYIVYLKMDGEVEKLYCATKRKASIVKADLYKMGIDSCVEECE